MEDFFKLTRGKLEGVLILVTYMLLSVFLVGLLSGGPRNLGSRELSLTGKIALGMVLPGTLLSTPGLYVSGTMFTTDVSLNEMMTESGCTNCTVEEYNQTAQKTTGLGWVAGVIVELLFLYILVSIGSLIRQRFFRK